MTNNFACSLRQESVHPTSKEYTRSLHFFHVTVAETMQLLQCTCGHRIMLAVGATGKFFSAKLNGNGTVVVAAHIYKPVAAHWAHIKKFFLGIAIAKREKSKKNCSYIKIVPRHLRHKATFSSITKQHLLVLCCGKDIFGLGRKKLLAAELNCLCCNHCVFIWYIFCTVCMVCNDADTDANSTIWTLWLIFLL